MTTIFERSAAIERAAGAAAGTVSGTLATDGEASDGHIIDIGGLEATAPKPLLFGHNMYEQAGTVGSWSSFAKTKHALRGTAQIELEGDGGLASARRDLAVMVDKGHVGAFSLRWDPIAEPVRRVNLSKDHPAYIDSSKVTDYHKLYGLFFPTSRMVEGSIVVAGADPKALIGRMLAADGVEARSFWRGAVEESFVGGTVRDGLLGPTLDRFVESSRAMRAFGVEDFGTLLRLCGDEIDPKNAVAVSYGDGKRVLIPRGAYDALCGEAAQRLALAFDLVTFGASQEEDEPPTATPEPREEPPARTDSAPTGPTLAQVKALVSSEMGALKTDLMRAVREAREHR